MPTGALPNAWVPTGLGRHKIKPRGKDLWAKIGGLKDQAAVKVYSGCIYGEQRLKKGNTSGTYSFIWIYVLFIYLK